MGKVAGGVERLDVFQRAYRLSLGVHRASLSWPKIEQYGGIADQMRRSSKSVCALVIEGSGRLARLRVEFNRYLVMAIGSADESRLWCRYAEDLGYLDPEQAQTWRDEFREIARMLHGLMQTRGVDQTETSNDETFSSDH